MNHQPNILHKRIKHKIMKDVKRIIRGYEIIFEEQDGCDEYGFMYWVDCRNGYSSRSWDVPPRIHEDVSFYLQQIASKGIKYKNRRYFLDPEIYFVNFLKYDKFEKPNFRIKIISEKQHQKKYNSLKESLA